MITQTACATTSYKDQRARSKHFNGEQFQNPTLSAKSFWSFLKMRMSESYEKWPNWVESDYFKINPVRVEGPTIHVSHINHSTVLLQVGGYNILTDPIYSERCSPVAWLGPKRVRNPGVKFEDLPRIDIVLVSHDHYDHLDLPTINNLIARDNPKIFVGLGVGKHLDSQENVFEMDWWQTNEPANNIKIHFVPVQHFSGRTLTDRNSTLWGGYVIEVAGRKIYFGGDTGYGSHFKETRERLGAIDLALLPIGAYEPRDFMRYAHVNPEEAVQAHIDLEAKQSIGIHYGTFQLTKEKIDDPVKQLGEALKKKGLNPSIFVAPEFGRVLHF